MLQDSQTSYSEITDELFYKETPLEWWFVQGYYEGDNVEKRYFMTSIFKHKISSNSSQSDYSFSMLFSILNPRTGGQDTSTRIDQKSLNAVINGKNNFDKMNLDKQMIEMFLNEVRDFGPPRNIELVNANVELNSDPFRIMWKDFILTQSGGNFILSFNELETGKPCKFELNALKEPLLIDEAKKLNGSTIGMDYVSNPQLLLSGEVNGKHVKGKAWLDHQWGDYSWIIADPNSARVHGWDWFGINLDDGSDLVILLRKDVQSGKNLDRIVVYRDKNSQEYITSDFELKTLRSWESHKTHIVHPVEWQIVIPEFEADLKFIPLSDDQEIPVFGLIRAIWEGAGKVTGIFSGKSVTGRARGEFYGYGYIFEFKDYLEAAVSRVDRHIESFLPKYIEEQHLNNYLSSPTWEYEPSAYTKMLSEPVWDLVSRGGKRWRPIFALLLLDALGGEVELFEPMICALAELSHTGSLIIDDIQDSSIKRRGKDSLHLRYGEDIAISAANTLYFLPLLLIFDHPHLSEQQKREVYEITLRQNIRAHFGQALDIYWSRNMNRKNLTEWMKDSLPPKILQMYALKTAAPIEGLAECVAIVAGADKSTKETCRKFALALGVSFQIIDDLHCFNNSPEFGKECGEDITEGKLTYVIYRSLETLQGTDRKRLKEILSSEELKKDPEHVNEAVDLVCRSGVLETCREEATSMVESEWGKLREQLQPSESKIMLRVLYQSLIKINYNSGHTKGKV